MISNWKCYAVLVLAMWLRLGLVYRSIQEGNETAVAAYDPHTGYKFDRRSLICLYIASIAQMYFLIYKAVINLKRLNHVIEAVAFLCTAFIPIFEIRENYILFSFYVGFWLMGIIVGFYTVECIRKEKRITVNDRIIN